MSLTPPVFRSASTLSVAVVALAALWTVLAWVSAALAPAASRAYAEAAARGLAEEETFLAYDAIAVAQLVVLVAALVLTSLWLGVVYGNATAIDPRGMRRSSVWTVLGWFVPFVSLWFPKQIVDDALRITGGVRVAPRLRTLTAAWWAAWLTMAFLSRLSDALPAEEGPVLPGVDVMIAVATTIALVLWVLVVRRLTAAQEVLVQRSVEA